jgi:hypothetical protein
MPTLEIRRLILNGQIEEALNLTFNKYPEVLDQTSDEGQRTLFLCRCQQFIELIRRGDLSQCLKFMTHELGTFCKQEVV